MMTQFWRFLEIVALASLVLALSGCGLAGSEEDSEESVTEMVTANVAGAANATESEGSFVASWVPQERHLRQVLLEALSPIQTAWADNGKDNSCKELWKEAECSEDAKLTLIFNGCRRGRAEWNGSEVFAFSSLAVCLARTQKHGIPLEGSVVRTFGGAIDDEAAPPTTRVVKFREVEFDTTTPYGFSTPVSGGVKVEFGLAENGTDPKRVIRILGIRHRGKSLRKNEVKFDHSTSTDSDHPLIVEKGGKDKVVKAGGIVKVQHNLAEYVATTTIVEDLKFAMGCCHPISGKVTTTYSIDKNGKQRADETMTFTNQCGIGSVTAQDGSSASVQLKHCF